MEQERTDIGTQRAIGRLEDLVGKAVTQLCATTARHGVEMVEVAVNVQRIVVHPVAIENHASMARDPAEKLRNIEMSNPHQAIAISDSLRFVSSGERIQVPLKDENHGVSRFQIERTLEW